MNVLIVLIWKKKKEAPEQGWMFSVIAVIVGRNTVSSLLHT